jgi:hypothetical protein
MRADIQQVDDPRFEALLETSAEVLGGLKKAFEGGGKDSSQKHRSRARQLRNSLSPRASMLEFVS